uniref:Uncharacterized protein n=1 Tax=Electrophorus electricus TaxID=8005 RepID=A0A4W4E3V8_ELEEL
LNKSSLQFEDKWDIKWPIIDCSYFHAVCLWDDKDPSSKLLLLSHQDDIVQLKDYIVEWRKFFMQYSILQSDPFTSFELRLMLDLWNGSIFCNIKNHRTAERLGELYSDKTSFTSIRGSQSYDDMNSVQITLQYVSMFSMFSVFWINKTSSFLWFKISCLVIFLISVDLHS